MTFFVKKSPLTAPRYAGEDYTPGFGEYLGAVWDDMWSDSPTASLGRTRELLEMTGGSVEHSGDEFDYDITYIPQADPALDPEQQNERIAAAGLEGHVKPQKDYTAAALETVMERKRAELARRDVRDRAPWAYAPAGLVAGLGTAALDPLNVAAAFVPVVGEARLMAMLGRASGPLARAGVRAGVGAVEGAVGNALVEPLVSLAKVQEQAEYGMTEAVMNVAFGALFGASMRSAGGAVADAFRARRNLLQPWERETAPAPEFTPEERQALEGRLFRDEPDMQAPDRFFDLIDESMSVERRAVPRGAAADRALAALQKAVDEDPVNVRLAEAWETLDADQKLTVFRVAAAQAGEGRRIDVEGLVLGRSDWLRNRADELLRAEAETRQSLDGQGTSQAARQAENAWLPDEMRLADEQLDNSLDALARSNAEAAEAVRAGVDTARAEHDAVLARIDLEERVLLEAAACDMRR